ncbi:AMP-binding protein [Mediterraneibacter glycyrrhizinilyticus]|uniref:AMP-binding protein n=1 Tax=Mediterraneibacter glycyrrhizinilyticus TaxID=342942 RepID=UPI001960EB9F|nr:AMP-binding protein [Mediterraneibacter glycyrrhizinilyticus]MBM6750053.1 AMP-binding protein [Mediterraneibacter glycyrrhizinilyticus]
MILTYDKIAHISNMEEYYQFIKDNYSKELCFEYHVDNRNKELYTYNDIIKYVNNATVILIKEMPDVSEESWIGLQTDNHPFWFVSCMALMQAGFNVLLIDNECSEMYRQNILKNSGAKGIITTSGFDSEEVKVILFDKFIHDVKDMENVQYLPKRRFANKMARCTSGTTGIPKIFVYKGEQTIAQLKASLVRHSASDITRFIIDQSAERRCVISSPLHHTLALQAALYMVLVGGIVIMTKRKTLSAFVNAIKEGRGQLVYAVPMLWDSMINLVKGRYKRFDETAIRDLLGGTVKLCCSAGAKTDPEIIRLMNRAGIIFIEAYGMTETGGLSSNTYVDADGRMNGSVGKIIPSSQYKMKLLKENGTFSDEGIGELLVAGDGLYYSCLIQGNEVVRGDEDGFGEYIRTGDIFEIKNNELFFKGRVKDVIVNASGENIYPEELEEQFKELVNFNIQYTILGIDDNPVIVVVLSRAVDGPKRRQKIYDMITKINLTLPFYQRLVSIYFTNCDLPLTPSLKVRKGELREKMKDEKNKYDEVKIMNNSVRKQNYTIGDIIEYIKNFFSEYMNIDKNEINEDSYIVEDIGASSFIIAEIYLNLQDEYQIELNEDFMLGKSITVKELAEMVLGELQ